MGLRTFLKQAGIPPDLLPKACLEEIARDAMSAAEIQSIGKNTAAKVAAYTQALELRAFQAQQLFFNPDRANMFLRDCARLRDIITSHGVLVPEILTS